MIIESTSQDLHEHPPIEIDLRIYANDGLELKVVKGHGYLGWAVKFGAVIYEKDEFWSKFVSTMKGRVPLPSAREDQERANSVN